jgi:hypothetical protein
MIRKTLAAALAVSLVALPAVAFGVEGIIDGGRNADGYSWDYLFQVFGSLVKLIITAATVVAAGFIMYGGWLYLTSSGDSAKIAKAHGVFKNVLWGFALLLAAWLIVVTILESLEAENWLLKFFGR